NYMFMPDKWHIHLDKETVENIGYRYEHRNEVSPEVKTLGHLDVAYMYAKRNQTEFAYAWAYKALQEVCPEDECRTFIEEGPDYKELLEKTLVEIASHMSPLIEYDQVIDVLCKFHDEGIGPRHAWEYFLLLQEAYRLKYKKDIYFFIKKRIDGKQYDLLKRCADGLVEKNLFPGYYTYAVMYSKGIGVEKDEEKARSYLEKMETYPETDVSVFGSVCSKMKMPLSDIILKKQEGGQDRVPEEPNDLKKDPVELGRAYRKGAGVEKDLVRSAEYYRTAISRGNKWIYKELCDVLWSMKTAEADREYVGILIPESNKGKHEAIGRLGKAYRDGRGVEKDLAKAKELFTKAVALDPKWKKQLDAMK
ncbi:MAG: hypothetical protein MJZ68_10110, partial [archaeon]|nr:hypothetical protein [archaeon]